MESAVEGDPEYGSATTTAWKRARQTHEGPDFAQHRCLITHAFPQVGRLSGYNASYPPTNQTSLDMIQARLILEELMRLGVTHIIGLPDNGSRSLFDLLFEHDDIEVMLVSREGEAFAIASGLLVGGARPLVLIQNTGLLEAGDAFRGTAYNMGLPLVMLIGYRGYGGHREGRTRIDTAATFLEPTLDAWSIPYTIATSDEDVGQIGGAFVKAKETSLPTAVVLGTQTG